MRCAIVSHVKPTRIAGMKTQEPPLKPHDMGGLPAGEIEPSDKEHVLWEKRVDAMMMLLQHQSRNLLTTVGQDVNLVGSPLPERVILRKSQSEHMSSALDSLSRTSHCET